MLISALPFLAWFGIYAAAFAPWLVVELSAFIFRDHPTFSKIVKHRKWSRALAGVALVVLFTHLVWPTY